MSRTTVAQQIDRARQIHGIRPATAAESAFLRTAEQSWHARVVAQLGEGANCMACVECRRKAVTK